MDLLLNHQYGQTLGVLDGRDTALPPCAFYLVDVELRILYSHGDDVLRRGEFLWQRYPATLPEQTMLRIHLDTLAGGNLLATLQGQPVLIFGGAFSQTGLLCVLIPTGEAACFFSAPGMYLQLFEGLLVSHALQGERKEHLDARIELALELYRAMARPLFPYTGARDAKALCSVLVARSKRLAAWMGVQVYYDFSRLEDGDVPFLRLPAYLGVLLGLLSLARHADGERTLHLSLQGQYPGDVLLQAELACEGTADLAELSLLERVFRARGAIFGVLDAPEAGSTLKIRATLGAPELSVQGVKEEAALQRAAREREERSPMEHKAAIQYELCFEEET